MSVRMTVCMSVYECVYGRVCLSVRMSVFMCMAVYECVYECA